MSVRLVTLGRRGWSRRLPTRRQARRDTRPLLVRARDEPELFGEFFAERREQVLRFFARRVLDPEAAFDLMAETFAAAFAALDDFRGSTEAECHAWLWAIARNKLFRWREKGEIEQRALRELGIDLPPMTSAELERAEELADLDAVRPQIAACLAALPPAYREAIRLRIIEERPYEVIAAELGVDETVVRARVSRGLRRLGTLLARDAERAREEVS